MVAPLACAGACSAGAAGASTGAAGAASAAPACANANLQPTATNLGAVDTATLCLVNRERAANGLRALHANRELGSVAATQVGSMVHRDYFADVGPSGRTPLSLVAVTRYRAHAAGVEVGQNIAWGTGSYTTPAHIVQEWMASPPHRKIMLSSEYRDAGVASTSAVPAVLDTRGHGATYVIEFGARL
ncbi:MAG TPA: CAP domain-containing protein [Solirubrobacteraceae bacterium]|jgi:uncharacterized protein YkwD|nr:CAP domain-containing protein [Solirubrobacteraceae bacterium]